jgi:hypothetical protein
MVGKREASRGLGAKNPDAAEILRKLVLPRLENKANAKLLQELQEAMLAAFCTNDQFIWAANWVRLSNFR